MSDNLVSFYSAFKSHSLGGETELSLLFRIFQLCQVLIALALILQFFDTLFPIHFLNPACLLGPAQVTLKGRLVRKKDCFVTHAMEDVGLRSYFFAS